MPHDANGQPLSVGDKVNVPCTVKSIQTGEEYCNVGLSTDHPMHPSDQPSSISLNAKQIVKA